MKTFRHIILALTALILASCAVDEFWEGTDYAEGEEVVMTFKPTFEDFETATKAIGDGTEVNTLLVHVYEGSSDDTPDEYTYEIKEAKVQSKVSIPFFHGKEYKVYFFAYKAGEGTAYKIADNGLKGGVTVTYPTKSLGFDALEALDAFYAVKDVNLSANVETSVSLTRPFAQVNLTADKAQLLAAKATEVKFEVSVATSYDFKNGAVGKPSDLTFSFVDDDDYFQNNDMISEKAVFLGTTYLFVPTGNSITATLTLSDEAGNVLKGPSEVSIPLASNNRTNLVFSGIEPAGPSWDDNEVKVPGADADGWIHITRPEQLAAFLLNSTADGAKVCIDNDIDMSEIPEEVATKLAKASKSVKSLTLNGNNTTISGLNLSAFFNEATNLNVYDLTLSGITVKGTSHVGVLVNTLMGESSFSNVNILNSSAATTNGAAGGMVGYIVRKSATDRSESMPIGFTDCQVISTSATGKESAGKFVGKFSGYDNGETLTFKRCSTSETSTSADKASPYVEGNKGQWLADVDFSTFDSWLGDEAYYRGVVKFGENRFQPKWDGEKTIEPLLANETYDAGTKAGTNRYVVYSAFDLAGLRKKTASPTALYLMTNVDMFGQGEDGKYNVPSNFASKYSSEDDNVFTPFQSVSTLDGKNWAIYNLCISRIKEERAAFILEASGTTIHKNIKFHNCCTVAVHKDVSTDAKAYGAILISNGGGTYTMENVNAYDCKVFALQKIGTLGASMSGTTTLKNNTITRCYIENYQCNISERFQSGSKSILGFTIDNVYADFYPHGEVGGMYGFIQGNSTLTDCKVISSTVNAYGQDDKMATVVASGWKGALAKMAVAAAGYYLVPGRHVSTMIGNIRATGTITLTNCTVDTDTKCTNRDDKHNSTYHYIGQAYYIEFLDNQGMLHVDGTQLTLANCNTNTKL